MAFARYTKTLVAALTALAFVGCRWAFWRDADPEETTVTPLGAWHRGMDLRATYETFPPGAEAKLTLLTDNPAAWLERWRLLAESERTLDLSYFILHEDVFGVSFLGHVLERAEHGVKVRLLLDAQGTKMSWKPRGNDYFDELQSHPNVEIKLYRPLPNRIVEAFVKLTPTAAVASEHDKIIAIDGRNGMIGGRNIGAEYFADPKRETKAFEDTDLSISSEGVGRRLVAAFDAQFESDNAKDEWGDAVNLRPRAEELLGAYRAMNDWLHGISGGVPHAEPDKATPWREGLRDFPELRGALKKGNMRAAPTVEAETRILDSQTRYGKTDDPITQAIARLVQAAKREIVVQSPYLVLSEEAVKLLEEAGKRGVRITLLTNSPVSSDNALSQAFFLEQWPQILARVPKMRLFVGGEKHTLHSKVAVFDRTLSLVGTYNLDPTSMTMNSEIVAAAWSEAFARRVLQHPKQMIAAGAPVVHEYRLRRDRKGAPVLDDDGRPQVAFGPEQHCDPKKWKSLTAFWTTLRAAEKVPGLSPIF
jgi:cardiolipin synthase C